MLDVTPCVYIYIYISIYIYIYTLARNMYICIRPVIYIYIYIYTAGRVHIYIYMYTCVPRYVEGDESWFYEDRCVWMWNLKGYGMFGSIPCFDTRLLFMRRNSWRSLRATIPGGAACAGGAAILGRARPFLPEYYPGPCCKHLSQTNRWNYVLVPHIVCACTE